MSLETTWSNSLCFFRVSNDDSQAVQRAEEAQLSGVEVVVGGDLAVDFVRREVDDHAILGAFEHVLEFDVEDDVPLFKAL